MKTKLEKCQVCIGVAAPVCDILNIWNKSTGLGFKCEVCLIEEAQLTLRHLALHSKILTTVTTYFDKTYLKAYKAVRASLSFRKITPITYLKH